MENIELKKEKAKDWFKNLRDQFCAAFMEIDNGTFDKKKMEPQRVRRR